MLQFVNPTWGHQNLFLAPPNPPIPPPEEWDGIRLLRLLPFLLGGRMEGVIWVWPFRKALWMVILRVNSSHGGPYVMFVHVTVGGPMNCHAMSA